MTPSTKNLTLLAQIPFFKEFTMEQLKWVDANTTEYAFTAKEEIPTSGAMKSTYWILLYGSWEMKLMKKGKIITLGVHQIGKWFQRNTLSEPEDMIHLQATSNAYILMVEEEEMLEMFIKKFPINENIGFG